MCERVTPRLSHANAAVVLSAVKVIAQYCYDKKIHAKNNNCYLVFYIRRYQGLVFAVIYTVFVEHQ